MTVTVFGYLILISTDFYDFISLRVVFSTLCSMLGMWSNTVFCV